MDFPLHTFWLNEDVSRTVSTFMPLLDWISLSQTSRLFHQRLTSQLGGRVRRYTLTFFPTLECAEEFFVMLGSLQSWIVGSVPLATLSTLSDPAIPANLNVLCGKAYRESWTHAFMDRFGFEMQANEPCSGVYAGVGDRFLTFVHSAVPGKTITVTSSTAPAFLRLFFAAPNTLQMNAISQTEVITVYPEMTSIQTATHGLVQARLPEIPLNSTLMQSLPQASPFPNAVKLTHSTAEWDEPCGAACPGLARSARGLRGIAHWRWNTGHWPYDPALMELRNFNVTVVDSAQVEAVFESFTGTMTMMKKYTLKLLTVKGREGPNHGSHVGDRYIKLDLPDWSHLGWSFDYFCSYYNAQGSNLERWLKSLPQPESSTWLTADGCIAMKTTPYTTFAVPKVDHIASEPQIDVEAEFCRGTTVLVKAVFHSGQSSTDAWCIEATTIQKVVPADMRRVHSESSSREHAMDAKDQEFTYNGGPSGLHSDKQGLRHHMCQGIHSVADTLLRDVSFSYPSLPILRAVTLALSRALRAPAPPQSGPILARSSDRARRLHRRTTRPRSGLTQRDLLDDLHFGAVPVTGAAQMLAFTALAESGHNIVASAHLYSARRITNCFREGAWWSSNGVPSGPLDSTPAHPLLTVDSLLPAEPASTDTLSIIPTSRCSPTLGSPPITELG
ncbi:hypothetical protein B0H11DRAFT_1923535 [Mycena galericulata]|nr:hypothetical protein B0H11DRAFT_1923535 [Mycena galericulata]